MLAILLGSVVGLFGARDAGTTALPLLKIATGPRAVAMGEAFSALADDATSIYWNPAGLGQLKNLEFFLSHQEFFMGFRDEYASLVVPAGTGCLGLGLTFSGVSGVEVWTPDNERGASRTTSNQTGVFSAGYGAPILDKYFVGAGAKLCYDYLGGATSGLGGGVDLGAIARPLPALRVGLSARNLGVAAYESNPYLYALPTSLSLGGSWQLADLVMGDDILNLAAEMQFPVDNSPSLHLGGEYTALRVITARIGFRTGPQDLKTLGLASGLTLGLGFRVGRLALDYAFVPYGGLGATHRVGIRTIVLPRGYGNVKIVTLDARSGEPLAADLDVTGIREGRYEANRQGKVMLARVPEGWLKVRASYPGYAPEIDSIYAYGDRDQTLTLRLGRPGRGAIWGRILDAMTKRNIGGHITYRGKAQGGLDVDSLAQSFVVRDLLGGDYELTARGPTPDYFPQSCTVRVEPDRVVTKDFYLVRKRTKIVLKGVNFETGKADLRPQDLPNLEEAGRILQENPTIRVELAGHTDPREISTIEFPSNWELSTARAEAVLRYLATKFAIAQDRMVARGYADTQPIAPNDTEEGMAKNRRTEFVILEE